MTAAARRVLDDALALPTADRAAVADALADSVPADPAASAPVPDPPGEDVPPGEHRAAWSAELNRRAAEIDSGAVKLVPAADVIRRLRERRAAGAG